MVSASFEAIYDVKFSWVGATGRIPNQRFREERTEDEYHVMEVGERRRKSW